MYRLKTGIFLLLLGVSFVVHAGTNLPMPQIKKVNDRVYALIGPIGLPNKTNNGYMANSIVIIGDKGVILVDTGFTDEIGRHLKQIIKGITDKPITHVINTHHHGDHSLGNSVFKGAEIISSAKCREWLNKTGYEWLETLEGMTGRKFPNTKPVPATRVYAEETKTQVTIQGVNMTLWVPKGSHTAGDLLIHLPQDKVLITGDVVVNSMIPSLRDAYVKTLVATVGEIAKMKVDTFIPGHGTLMKVADVKKLHKLLSGFYQRVEAGYKKGLMDSEIRKTLDLTEWKKYAAFEELMGANISRTYLEVEAANF